MTTAPHIPSSKKGLRLGTKVFLLCLFLSVSSLILNTGLSLKKNRDEKRRHLYYALLVESVSFADRINDLVGDSKAKVAQTCTTEFQSEMSASLKKTADGLVIMGQDACAISVDLKRLDGLLASETLSNLFLYSANSKELVSIVENSFQHSLSEAKTKDDHPLLEAARNSPFKRSTLDFDFNGKSFAGSFVKIPSQEGLFLVVESNRQSLIDEIKVLTIQQILIASILVGLCLIAALLFSKKITAPIQSLMEFADNLAAGRYGEKSTVKTHDELEELSDHFTWLSEKLLDREKQLELASDLVSRDGMTGLYNFRFFSQKLEEHLPLAVRNGWPVGLLLIDVDHFKKVNDTFGHPQGDYVLKMLSALLLKCARKTDYVCRYGGEEFVILASPETTQEGSLVFAERIRSAFEALEIELLDRPGETMKATLSIGVANFLPKADFRAPVPKPQDLVKIADAKLYEAKNLGRNRVVL